MEKHYVRAVCAHLDKLRIPYTLEHEFELKIEGALLGKFKVDLFVDRKIVVEFKATDRLTNDHKMQLLRYLEALDSRLGILVNFRVRPLQIWRVPN